MREVVIVDGIRTPIARAHKEKGLFRTLKSPDLLAALQTILSYHDQDEINDNWQLNEARAAIAKAKGTP